MKKYLGLDFGGTFVKYALMDEQGTFLESGSVKSDVESLDGMLDSIRVLEEKYHDNYDGVAVSMPGRIDTKRGIAHTGGAYKFIIDTPFAKELEGIFHKHVVIANDGKCAAAAEVFDGSLADVDNGCVLVLGTATGGGIVLNKKIWMGSSFGGGELSNLLTDFSPIQNDISNPLGTLKYLWALKASASGLIGNYAVKKGLPIWGSGLDGYQYFEAYDAGDEDAITALEEFGDGVAAGIMSIQAVLDLERYAIGGGISARKEVRDAIAKALDNRYDSNPLWPFMKPEIVSCKYGNNANLLGALSFYLQTENN